MRLWIVSRHVDDVSQWELIGVFTSLDLAVAECRDQRYGVWTVLMDVAVHDAASNPHDFKRPKGGE